MPPNTNNQMTTVALRPNYGVFVYVVKRDGSAALPVGEPGERGDWIVRTTLRPEHVNGDTLVAGKILFNTNGDRLRFVQQTKVGRVE